MRMQEALPVCLESVRLSGILRDGRGEAEGDLVIAQEFVRNVFRQRTPLFCQSYRIGYLVRWRSRSETQHCALTYSGHREGCRALAFS